MMKSYAARVIRFAIRGFAIRTDVWYALISLAVSAFSGGAKPLTEITTRDVAQYFLVAVAVYIALRFLAAPYYIWKEDQAELAGLKQEVARPALTERHKLAEHRAARRSQLVRELGHIRSLAEHEYYWNPGISTPEGRDAQTRFFRTRDEALALIDELGFDDAPRDACLHYVHLCGVIMNENRTRDGDPTEAKALLQAMAGQVIEMLVPTP